MSHQCPLCGGAVPEIELRIDLSNNHAIVRGRPIRLTPQGAEILDVISHAYPTSVPISLIIRRVYGLKDEPGDPEAVVHQQVFHLRRKLKPVGYMLVNEYGAYRLAKVTAQKVAA